MYAHMYIYRRVYIYIHVHNARVWYLHTYVRTAGIVMFLQKSKKKFINIHTYIFLFLLEIFSMEFVQL